jgi:hypothetical protein
MITSHMTTVKEPPNGSKSRSFFKSVVSKLKPPVAPVSLGAQQPTPSPLKSQIPDLPSPENVSRCEFTFSDGRQCCNQRVPLCAHHSSKQKRGAKRVSDASALEALCSDLTTATTINRALAQTFLLMAQGRISRKDAVAFGYLSQLLLQSVSGVRAEYVAANGYRQWENKLKSSLASNPNDDPPPSPQNPGNEPNGVILSESASADERRISPNPTQERPLAERIMGKPDYQSLLTRSLDMLDRKYDFTPEGRSESQKLALELELMNPAPAKPAKGFFGQTVDLMRRFRDGGKQNSGAASIPPAVDYYSRRTPPPWADERNEQPVSPPPSRGTSSPNVPDQQSCSSGRGEPCVPEAQRSCAPSASGPADFVAPPSRRHRKPRSYSGAPRSAPHSELPLPVPASAPAAKHDSLGGPDADHHEGHRTDWYAPPSWSKIRQPDPCPSRKEKLQRKLRSMSNSAFRRLQHRNSRGF